MVAITVALIYAPRPSPDAVYIPLVQVSVFSCLLLRWDPRLQAVCWVPLLSSLARGLLNVKDVFLLSVCEQNPSLVPAVCVSIHGLAVDCKFQ